MIKIKENITCANGWQSNRDGCCLPKYASLLFCSLTNGGIELRTDASTQKIHVYKAHVHEINDKSEQTNEERKELKRKLNDTKQFIA